MKENRPYKYLLKCTGKSRFHISDGHRHTYGVLPEPTLKGIYLYSSLPYKRRDESGNWIWHILEYEDRIRNRFAQFCIEEYHYKMEK